jgi:hypothetical protein
MIAAAAAPYSSLLFLGLQALGAMGKNILYYFLCLIFLSLPLCSFLFGILHQRFKTSLGFGIGLLRVSRFDVIGKDLVHFLGLGLLLLLISLGFVKDIVHFSYWGKGYLDRDLECPESAMGGHGRLYCTMH